MPTTTEASPATAAEPPERTSLGAWWMVSVLLLFYVLSLVDRQVLTMLVVPIQADLGLTDFQMSLLLGPAFAVFHVIGGFPLGWAADRFSRRWLVGVGVAVWSLATFASGLSRSFASLFMARVFVGVFEGSLSPSAYSLIADKFPPTRLTTGLAVFGMGPKLGTAAALALGAFFFTLSSGIGDVTLPVVGTIRPWQLTLILLGAPGLLLALLVFTFSEPPRRNLVRSGGGGKAHVLRFLIENRAILAPVLIGFSLVALSSASLLSWSPTYMTREYGWTPAQYGPVMSLISLISAGSVLIKGLVVDWLFARGMRDAHIRFYTWILMAALPCLAMAFAVDNPWAFLVLYGIVNIAALSFMVYTSAVLQLVTPSHLRGQVTALMVACITILASGVAPTAVAAMTDFVFGDPQAIGKSLAIVSVTSLLASLVLLRLALKPLRATLASLDQAPADPVAPSTGFGSGVRGGGG